jgi:hypothetical protein
MHILGLQHDLDTGPGIIVFRIPEGGCKHKIRNLQGMDQDKRHISGIAVIFANVL